MSAICTFMICEGQPRPSSISPAYRSASLPKSSLGAKSRSSGSSADMSVGRPQRRPPFNNSTRLDREQGLQSYLRNRTSEMGLSVGAGEGNRTLDIQLGKLSFYH